MTPLLVLYAMHAKWGSSCAQEGFGYYPGMKLKKRDGAAVPLDDIDLDVVALWSKKPVLVECKESAKPFNDPDEATKFAVQLGKRVKLAEHVGARKVIVASPSRFPEDKSTLTEHVPEGSTVEIEWWDEDVLLDPVYFTNELKANDAERWHLQWLASSLADSYGG